MIHLLKLFLPSSTFAGGGGSSIGKLLANSPALCPPLKSCRKLAVLPELAPFAPLISSLFQESLSESSPEGAHAAFSASPGMDVEGSEWTLASESWCLCRGGVGRGGLARCPGEGVLCGFGAWIGRGVLLAEVLLTDKLFILGGSASDTSAKEVESLLRRLTVSVSPLKLPLA